jgi:Domain of unknown function (DUF4129)
MARMYRAGIIGVLMGLLAYVPAAAQTADTVRVGQEADTTREGSGATSEPLVLRTMSDSMVTAWKSDPAFEYANDPEYWRREKIEGPRGDSNLDRVLASRAFEYFLLCLLGAGLLYAIIRIIADNRLQLFYRSPKRVRSGKAEEAGEAIQDDLEGQLTHFIQTKEYRQAVRFLFLKTLRLLNDRGMIRYHRDGTNQEYGQQLAVTPQGAPFRDLTTIYEKVWYGEFPLGDVLFARLRQYFEDFYKNVRA